MKALRKILQCAGVFGGVLLALWLLLTASALIPNRLIQKNMEKSALYYTRLEAFAYSDGNKLNGIADHYADSIWVNVAWYMGKGNPLVSAIDTKYYDGEQKGQNIGLYLAVTEKNTEPNTDYTRYWHGTAGIIRILHLFTEVNGIKYMGFIAALGLAAVIMILLIRDKKDMLAIAFFLSLCMVKIWNIRLSMEYQPAFILCFLMCILYLLAERKGNRALLLLSVAGGELAAFFDFLTTETMVILLPLILVITIRALEGRMKEWKDAIRFVSIQGSVWLISYGMTFVVKWGLASVLTRENEFAAALSSAGERMNWTAQLKEGTGSVFSILTAPAANLSALFGGVERIETSSLTAGILLLTFFILISVICIRKGKAENKTATKILFILGSMILVRYMVLNNHSYLHAFFTYRGLLSLIMAMFSIMVINCTTLNRNE